MVASINFLSGSDFVIDDLSGSGLGFFGAGGFSSSVRVGEYNSRTYITDGAGVNQGPEADNAKFDTSSTVILGQSGSGIALTAVPNYQSTLNLRFTYDTPVQVQNPTIKVYDRVSEDNAGSGAVVKIAEAIHPGLTQANEGSGSTSWVTFDETTGGSGMELSPSPGVSGLYCGNGSNSTWSDTQHDWYCMVTCSPSSIGSKSNLGILLSLEYL